MRFTWPLRKGDDVLVVVAEQSLDEWRGGMRGDVRAADPRRFNLTDAVAIPVGVASSASAAASMTTVELGYDTGAMLRLDPRGTLSLGSPAVELVSVLVDLLAALQGAVIDVAGPTGAMNATTVAQLKSLELKLRMLKR